MKALADGETLRPLPALTHFFWPILFLAVMPWPTATADWIELAGGGVITGDVAAPNDQKTFIRTSDEIIVAVDASAVRRRIDGRSLEAYRDARQQAGLDPPRNEQLARWCRQRGNLTTHTKQYRDFHLRRVVFAQPDHSVAWATLGYKPRGNEFVPVDELMRDRGMVRTRGGWEMPEVALRQRQQESDEVAEKTWIRDIARLVKSIQRGGSRAEPSVEELSAINDPLAVTGLAEAFERLGRGDAISLRPLRKLLLDKMIAIGSGITIRTLVAAGLNDPDPILREAALTALAESPAGRSSAVATYLPMLGSNNNDDINRAATALIPFADPELDLTYTAALVSQHKQVVAPGAGINTTFGGAGNSGGGLTTGGKAKVLTRNRQNPAVLSLLRTIAPHVNFGYDEAAWRNYFVGLRTRSPGDLRADPLP